MAQGRRESEGDIGVLVGQLTALAAFNPVKVLESKDLNPYRKKAMSEAMRKHLEEWEKVKWRSAVESSNASR